MVKSEPISSVVIELKDFSVASKALLSLIDLSVVLEVKKSFLSVLKVSDIFNGINITKFLKGN